MTRELFAILSCGATMLPAAALAQHPTWSRGGRYLPTTYEECVARAELANKAQGLKVVSNNIGVLLGTKGNYLAVVSCGRTADSRMVVNIIVAGNGAAEKDATALRDALNEEMRKSSCRATPWGFQHCHGKPVKQ